MATVTLETRVGGEVREVEVDLGADQRWVRVDGVEDEVVKDLRARAGQGYGRRNQPPAQATPMAVAPRSPTRAATVQVASPPGLGFERHSLSLAVCTRDRRRVILRRSGVSRGAPHGSATGGAIRCVP